MKREKLRALLLSQKRDFWTLRQCSICDHPIGYALYLVIPDRQYVGVGYWRHTEEMRNAGELVLIWDPRCDCTSLDGREKRDWIDILDLIERQRSDAGRNELLEIFGLREVRAEGGGTVVCLA